MVVVHVCALLRHRRHPSPVSCFFFFNDTATTEIYTLSLHDALPISIAAWDPAAPCATLRPPTEFRDLAAPATMPNADRKSTRLNSSHSQISYAVFCLKKKKTRMVSYITCPTFMARSSARLHDCGLEH